MPLSALGFAVAYAFAARLAGSWSDIHGDRTAAVVVGVAVGAALTVLAVIGGRKDVPAWLVLPALVLVVCIVTTRQELAPVAGPPGKITTGLEAAQFALCSVLFCASAFLFIGFMPRLWRARMAFSVQERGLHITRASDWRQASAAPILRDEWQRFAGSRDDLHVYDPSEPRARQEYLTSLRRPGERDDSKAVRRLAAQERQLQASRQLIATRPDIVARDPRLLRLIPPQLQGKTFAYERGDGSRMYLTWINSEIVVTGMSPDRMADVTRIQPIAWALAARLIDDDGTVYDNM